MKNSDELAKIMKGFVPPKQFQVCVGRVIKAPPELTISIIDGKVILYPHMLYMNDRLFDDYTRKYKLDGNIESITINATTSNQPCGSGATNQHGTISGSGEYKSNGTFINTDTLVVGDLVKVTPTEKGQMWIVDFKVRKIKEKK